MAALSVLGLNAQAQDARNFSYQSSARAQSADEMEDIGEIQPSAKGAEADLEGKGVAPAEEQKPRFRFNVTARGEYTSNAKLSGNHSSGDFIAMPTVEGGYNVALGKYFTFDLGLKVESGIYADNSDRGFVGYSALATLDYRPSQKAPRIYVSAEPYRYDSFDTGDSITQAAGLAVGTDWGVSFNQGRSLVFVGYTFSHYFSDPNIDDRNSNRVVFGVAHQLRQNLTGQLFYSWQHNEYTGLDRYDSRHIVGLNFLYQISENWFGSFTTSLVDNDSNQDNASYQSATAAVGVTVQF